MKPKIVSKITSFFLGVKFPVQDGLICDKPEFQGNLAQSRNGDSLLIVHAEHAKNPYRVYAYSVTLNAVLGVLKKPLARDLVSVFGKGFCLDGQIISVLKNDGEPFRCKVEVSPSHSNFSGETAVLPE